MSVAVTLGLLPPIFLLIYIYRVDKIEREPAGLLLSLFLLGMLSTIPAIVLEMIGGGILGLFGTVDESPTLTFLEVFLVVAPAEEFCKRFMAKKRCWNHPAFDYRFDAVVYCTASALGFAAAENVLYMLDMDAASAVWRLVPVHTICGLYMGVYLGQAKAAEVRGESGRRRWYLIMSMLIPVLIHGGYDFGVSSESDLVVGAVLIGTVILTIISFRKLKASAKEDQPLFSQRYDYDPNNTYGADSTYDPYNAYGPDHDHNHYDPYDRR